MSFIFTMCLICCEYSFPPSLMSRIFLSCYTRDLDTIRFCNVSPIFYTQCISHPLILLFKPLAKRHIFHIYTITGQMITKWPYQNMGKVAFGKALICLFNGGCCIRKGRSNCHLCFRHLPNLGLV